jgi:hypothetical protein
MKTQVLIASGILLAGFGTILLPVSAQALTTKECSAKYQAAKKAGTLNGMKWNDFRKAECGAQATAAPAPSSTTTPPAGGTPTASGPPAKPKTRSSAMAPTPTGNIVFPSGVDPKYSKESAGRARLHTCDDQYKANKATNANGGLRWIQKGGGYWSLCDKHLKGA